MKFYSFLLETKTLEPKRLELFNYLLRHILGGTSSREKLPPLLDSLDLWEKQKTPLYRAVVLPKNKILDYYKGKERIVDHVSSWSDNLDEVKKFGERNLFSDGYEVICIIYKITKAKKIFDLDDFINNKKNKEYIEAALELGEFKREKKYIKRNIRNEKEILVAEGIKLDKKNLFLFWKRGKSKHDMKWELIPKSIQKFDDETLSPYERIMKY